MTKSRCIGTFEYIMHKETTARRPAVTDNEDGKIILIIDVVCLSEINITKIC